MDVEGTFTQCHYVLVEFPNVVTFKVGSKCCLLIMYHFPGTEFMARLQEQLTYFVHNKLSTDKLWQNIKVYLSGHEVCESLPSALVSSHRCSDRAQAVIALLFLVDSRGRRTQDHGVHSLGEHQARP